MITQSIDQVSNFYIVNGSIILPCYTANIKCLSSNRVYHYSVFMCADNSKEIPSFEFIISDGENKSTLFLANISRIDNENNDTTIIAVTVSVGLFLLISIIRKYKKS